MFSFGNRVVREGASGAAFEHNLEEVKKQAMQPLKEEHSRCQGQWAQSFEKD